MQLRKDACTWFARRRAVDREQLIHELAREHLCVGALDDGPRVAARDAVRTGAVGLQQNHLEVRIAAAFIVRDVLSDRAQRVLGVAHA